MAEENKAIDENNLDLNSSDADSLKIEENNSLTENNDNEEDNSIEIDQAKEEFVKSKKKSLIKKILLGVVAFLILFLTIGVILYFTGFFEQKEEIIKQETKNEPLIEEKINEVPEYKFNMNDINSKKLNEQLSYLTNKNINQEKNEELEKIENEKKLLEEQKKKEEEALKLQEEALIKEKEALEERKLQLEDEKLQLEALKQEAIQLKEELMSTKIKLEETPPQTVLDTPKIIEKTEEKIEEVENISATENNDVFLKFISVAKIKGELYKTFLDKITAIDSNLLLCRDDKNRIEIYYGPFDSDEKREILLNKLISNDFNESYELEFTKEEFDKRCNY